jgi:acetyl esterase/lipase
MPAGPFPVVPTVQWKDAVYDAARGLKVRVYKPPPPPAGDKGSKLPVLVYFHGGGYCLGTYDHPSIPCSTLYGSASPPRSPPWCS